MPIFVGAGTSSFMKGSDGVGFTRINTTQRNALTAVEGQVIFNTTSGVLEYYDGSAWAKVSAVLAVLSSVSGNIFAGAATNLTLSGTGFLASNLVVNFNQSADNINVNVTVTPSSDTAATVAVPSSVYNNVTAGNVVTIKVTNSDGSTSGTVNKTAVALPSGGTKTTSGGYTYHTFTSSGNFVNTIASLSTEFLLVAGGGGGGSGDDGSGGGSGAGAGGAIDGTATLNVGTYGVVIGGGGAGGQRSGGGNVGTNGSNSTFNSNTAIGGGFGLDNGATTVGQGGGSGGGGFRSGSVGSGTSGQGTNGGSGAGAGAPGAGGGGGGKGGGGGNATSTNGGSGGPGINWKSLGTFYAGGGGGGGDGSGPGGSGGSSVGGNGTNGGTQSNNSNHAVANRGSGGGGTGGSTGTYYRGSNGSGGILIIRYQL